MLTIIPVFISVFLGIVIYSVLKRMLGSNKRGVSITLSAGVALVFMRIWFLNLSDQLNAGLN